MIWSFLADTLVILHFGFTSFVVFGGFLTWRWPRLAVVHLPALAWGCWVEVSHTVCPLTPLENHFRHLGGEAGYSGGFLAHYLLRVLYPVELTGHIQWTLATALIAVNVIAYWGLVGRWRSARP
jgi:hypothetical protein